LSLHIPGLGFKLDSKLKLIIVVVVIAAFTIQALRVLDSAYPIMSKGVYDGAPFSLDFGAYYTAAWRLVNNPTQLYTPRSIPGDPSLGGYQPGFKYLPFFSFFMLPFLLLDYIPALATWDVFQLLLLPVMGLLLYKALKNFNVIVILGMVWIVLLQPIPFPPHYTVSFYDLYTSQSYYWQWAEGQAKVFETFLIVAAYYLAKTRRSYLAGITYGLAFFDPRFPVYALPLFLIVSWGQYKKFAVAAVMTLIIGDSILFYDGLLASFINEVAIGGWGNPFYQYTYIPFYTIIALTVVEGTAFLYRLRRQRANLTLPKGIVPRTA
jgi:hypothetical protein